MTTKDTIETIGAASAGAGLSYLFFQAFLLGMSGALGGLVLRLIYVKWFKKYFENDKGRNSSTGSESN